jgi:uncharacterized membrane protein YphA (DoxX/SURF4 family)
MCRFDSYTPIRGGFDVEEDQVDVVVLIGRVLFALIAVGSAFGGHFMATDSTAGYAESRGVKNSRAMVLISGVLLVAAAVSLIAGIYADLEALLFGSFTLLTAFMIHHFWTDDDEMTKQIEMTNFMKNLSITGGALLAFALFATAGDDIGLTVTGSFFDLSF